MFGFLQLETKLYLINALRNYDLYHFYVCFKYNSIGRIAWPVSIVYLIRLTTK